MYGVGLTADVYFKVGVSSGSADLLGVVHLNERDDLFICDVPDSVRSLEEGSRITCASVEDVDLSVKVDLFKGDPSSN